MEEVLEGRKGSTVYTGKRRERLFTTKTRHYRDEDVPVSRDWIKWAFIMKWEYAKKGYDNEEEKRNFLVFFAARCGYKGVLEWLKSIGCALSNRACDGARAAAYGGHI